MNISMSKNLGACAVTYFFVNAFTHEIAGWYKLKRTNQLQYHWIKRDGNKRSSVNNWQHWAASVELRVTCHRWVSEFIVHFRFNSGTFGHALKKFTRSLQFATFGSVYFVSIAKKSRLKNSLRIIMASITFLLYDCVMNRNIYFVVELSNARP